MSAIIVPQFCELSILPNGDFLRRTTDSAKQEVLAGATVDLAKRFFCVRDDAGDNADARDYFKSKGSKNRNWDLVRDSINSPASAEYVQRIDGGTYNGPVRPAAADPNRFFEEAARLRAFGYVTDSDMPDFNDHESIVKFFGKVNDEIHTRYRNKTAGRVLDAAPSIYVFSELLKHVPVLIEEEWTQLWARRVFPIRNLNTWLPQWSYKRYGRRGSMPEYVDVDRAPTNINQQTERVKPVVRQLAFYDNGCFWDRIELERHAEAVANGAANISLDRDRIDTAVRMMLEKENLITWFGDPDVNVLGMFSPEADTLVQRIPAAGLFGAGTTEQDRALLTNPAKQIVAQTEQALQPNMMMLSTFTWIYVNDKRYGTADNPSDQTVAEAALASLQKFGITSFLWVPEVGYRAVERDRLLAHGIPAAEAARLAGGLNSEQTMVVGRRDPKVAEMIVGKERIMYPGETVHGRTEVRMLQGSGGMEFYQPAGYKIVTNCGPNSVL